MAPREVPHKWEFMTGAKTWRRPNIERKDVDNFGVASVCPGCVAASRGAPSRSHTESCRQRMEEDMTKRNDETIIRYSQRIVAVSEEVVHEINKGEGGDA